MILERLKASGMVVVEKNGEVVCEEHNLVVDVGEAWIAARMKDNVSTLMSAMGLGSGVTGGADGTLVQLVTEITSDATRESVIITVTDNVIQFVSTWGPGSSTGSINEAGIFSDNTFGQGIMLARTVFGGPITKDVNDTLTITWSITIAAV